MKMKMKSSDNKDYYYIEALEEERKKIQVFHRELPLCLDLVNQAIENFRKQIYDGEERSECDDEEQTVISEGRPVLEEFLPLKRSSSEEDDDEEEESKRVDEKLGKNKVDWLKSVQLWNQNPDPVPMKEDDDMSGIKSSKIDLKKKCGGAFQPFHSEKSGISSSVATSIEISAPSTAATSSTTGDTDGSNKRKNREENKEGDVRRKTRRSWSQELHRRFLEALQQLGGSHVATPKQIKELMKVDGLTNDEVKSHLQKYRIHTRGPSSTTSHNIGNPQPPQFVVVGGIWVPPPEYVTTAEAIKENTTRMTTNGIYVPLAAPPQQAVSTSCCQQQQSQQHQQQQKQQHQSPTGSLHSEGRSKVEEHSINGIYVPLAAPPQQAVSTSCSQQQQQSQQHQQQQKQQHQSPTGSLHSEGRSKVEEHSINVGHSNSPTTSSSTVTDDNVSSKLTCN